MPEKAKDLTAWIGRAESLTDIVTPVPARALAATLDRNPTIADGDALPLPWHWLYCLPLGRQSSLGEDGHPKRGGFLPPIRQPRRMWAGSRIAVTRALRIGDHVTRTSTIDAIKEREGKSGRLVFVTVRHGWHTPDTAEPALEEWQDIVYRDAPTAGEAPAARAAAPADAQWSRTIDPDAVLLMRYSALTFNSHRIHYDLPYATTVEGYPGLVVHGPLIATLLLDAVRRERPAAFVREFAFRAVAPLIAGRQFTVNGRDDGGGKLALWAADATGTLAMQASATIA
jgi:3-methylfumaryl-CoA hydratase